MCSVGPFVPGNPSGSDSDCAELKEKLRKSEEEVHRLGLLVDDLSNSEVAKVKEIARLTDIIQDLYVDDRVKQDQLERQKDRIERLENAIHYLERDAEKLRMQLELPLSIFHELNDEITKYHYLGQMSGKPLELRGTLNGYLGLHPCDVYPNLTQVSVSFDNEHYSTWSWDTKVNDKPLWRLIGSFTQTYNFKGWSIPLYAWPDIAGLGYDADPPYPEWKSTTAVGWLCHYRTSILEPELASQNAVYVASLNNWWKRVGSFYSHLHDLVRWARELRP